MRIKLLFIVSAAVLIGAMLARAAEPAAEKVIHVSGVVEKSGDWSVDRLKRELASELKSVEFTARDQKHHANCVPLLALLKASGAPTTLNMDPSADPKTKNYPLRLIVQIQGTDGYTANFSLAELLPDIGAREVWLALDIDDKPLPEKEQPVRLIVPTDAKPARWVHAIGSISLIDSTPATTQPAK